MNNAIDPIGAATPYAVTPKSMRANQAEQEEQIDLIRKLEADEQEEKQQGEHHQSSDERGNEHGDENKKDTQKEVVDIVQLSSAVRQEATENHQLAEAKIAGDEDPETSRPRTPAHIDLKA